MPSIRTTDDGMGAAHLIQRIRERCEESFEFTVRYFFRVRKGVKFQFNEHHHILCADLEAVYRGEIQNYICNIPPRYSKTELVVILFTVWCFIKNRRCEFIHLSYSQPLVMENSDAIRSIIKSVEFQQLWPGLSIRDNKDAKGAWATLEGGQFLATAMGGSVTGFGAGRLDEADGERFNFSGALIIDDPLKPDDARHDTMRQAVNRRWDETIKSRRNSPRTPTICIMQRIHEEDFTHELLQDTSMEWFHRVMPALVNEGTPEEHALWPAKHTIADLLALRAKNAYAFAAQMQQRPSPLGGGILRGDWFPRYRQLPPLRWRKVYADTAQKTKERNDYSVFECWGMGKDGRIYLIDLLRGKWEAPELKRRAVDFWAKHKAFGAVESVGALRQMMIEDKASGTGLIQDLRLNGRVPVKGIERTIDKLTRVLDVNSYIEAGFVCIPEEAPWVADFVSECESFTADDTHAHDDQIDPMCDAINDMLSTDAKARLWETAT